MDYPSILFTDQGSKSKTPLLHDVFKDLKLDRLLGEKAAHCMEYTCKKADILARQAAFKELEDNEKAKAAALMYEHISDVCRKNELYTASLCKDEKDALFVSLFYSYCRFVKASAASALESPLLKRFTAFFSDLSSKKGFIEANAAAETAYACLAQINDVSFSILNEELTLTEGSDGSYAKRLYECARELKLDVIRHSGKFAYALAPKIIEGIKKLYPSQFSQFSEFRSRFSKIYDESVTKYDDELAFYLSVRDTVEKVKAMSIPFTYPSVSDEREYVCTDAYDLSLILKNERNIVPNDILLNEKEPFFFLTGANGGGKTTYLRTVGLNLCMFLTGCPIAAVSARIYPFSGVFTHFPHDERFEDTGRFLDEQIRLEKIFNTADNNGVILLNETFSTTTEEIALKSTRELAKRLQSEGKFGIYITHQHALTTDVPALSVIIDENDSNRRTYKISRSSGKKSSFADDILKKYALTREQLGERFGVCLK